MKLLQTKCESETVTALYLLYQVALSLLLQDRRSQFWKKKRKLGI
jgi:hypothetical protein